MEPGGAYRFPWLFRDAIWGERLLERLLLSGGYGPGGMPVRVVGWDDASLNGRPVTVVYYETRDGGGSVRTYPGDSRRLAYAAARPRALMPGARLHGGNAYVEP